MKTMFCLRRQHCPPHCSCVTREGQRRRRCQCFTKPPTDRSTDRPRRSHLFSSPRASEKEKAVHLAPLSLISTPNRTADHPSTYVSSNLASSVDDRSGPSGSAGGRDGTGETDGPTVCAQSATLSRNASCLPNSRIIMIADCPPSLLSHSHT